MKRNDCNLRQYFKKLASAIDNLLKVYVFPAFILKIFESVSLFSNNKLTNKIFR